jgi:hypothetical protein
VVEEKGPDACGGGWILASSCLGDTKRERVERKHTMVLAD